MIRTEPGIQTDDPLTPTQYDVAIAGAGLGGLAAAIYLRQFGAHVVCIEPEQFPHARVGESLDWSAPALLKALGLERESFIADQSAFYKKKVRLTPLGKPSFEGGPHDWFQKKPLGFETTTLHVDRVAFDQRLFERAQALGVEFIWDRVASVEREGDRVTALQTAQHGRVSARWFVDGSGQARLFGRAFNIPKIDYGRRKVCVWRYFETEAHFEGTSFYGDDLVEYLSWIWEIPINPHAISVGCIMAADEFETLRRSGKSVAAILHEQLAPHPRFAPLLAAQPEAPVRTASYRCYVHDQVCGPNWVMTGEAASLPDPLTANGVTAAMRHAKDASGFIKARFQEGTLTPQQRRIYDTNVRQMGHAFNYAIETCAYEPRMRWVYGSLVAMTVYTAFSYTINALYTKFNPQTLGAMTRFGIFFAINKAWIGSWSVLARAIFRVRRPTPRPRPANANAT